ncbi:MAG: hypothetical protein HY537_01175 [Deltaproteobacteria bacterium]|nr:hypothetical protein [Deltaproteobacteria bacterium]
MEIAKDGKSQVTLLDTTIPADVKDLLVLNDKEVFVAVVSDGQSKILKFIRE